MIQDHTDKTQKSFYQLDIKDFIAGRFRRIRPSGSSQAPSFCLSSSFLNPPPLKDDYTLLICHKKINMSFPLDSFLKAASNLPNPTISLSYWSLFSFQGIIWSLLTKYKLKNLLCTNEGPFVPISPFYVNALIEKNGYQVIHHYGLGLLSPFRNKYLLPFYTTFPFLRFFARTRLLILQKKDDSKL